MKQCISAFYGLVIDIRTDIRIGNSVYPERYSPVLTGRSHFDMIHTFKGFVGGYVGVGVGGFILPA